MNGEMNIDGCRRLVVAVLREALKDARGGDPDARRWLFEHGAAWLGHLEDEGIDSAVVRDRLMEAAQGDERWFHVTKDMTKGKDSAA